MPELTLGQKIMLQEAGVDVDEYLNALVSVEEFIKLFGIKRPTSSQNTSTLMPELTKEQNQRFDDFISRWKLNHYEGETAAMKMYLAQELQTERARAVEEERAKPCMCECHDQFMKNIANSGKQLDDLLSKATELKDSLTKDTQGDTQ